MKTFILFAKKNSEPSRVIFLKSYITIYYYNDIFWRGDGSQKDQNNIIILFTVELKYLYNIYIYKILIKKY